MIDTNFVHDREKNVNLGEGVVLFWGVSCRRGGGGGGGRRTGE